MSGSNFPFCSFAIILYEIHGRKGPFGNSRGLKTHEILNLLLSQSFHPPLEDLDNCMDFVKIVLKDGWDENPEMRPDFKVSFTGGVPPKKVRNKK